MASRRTIDKSPLLFSHDAPTPEFLAEWRRKRRKRWIDYFAGGGGASKAIEIAFGYGPMVAVNHDAAAIRMHAANHRETWHVIKNVWEADPVEITGGEPVDFMWASPDCFPAGTMIFTRDGMRPIQDVKEGDQVLTHRGRWQPVISTLAREADTVEVRGYGHFGLVTTPNHPFYSKRITKRYPGKKPDGKRAGEVRTLVENPYWPAAKGMTGKLWATPRAFPEAAIPTCAGVEFTEDFFYWLGRWIGDGSINKGDVEICCGNAELELLATRFGVRDRPIRRAGGEAVPFRVVDHGSSKLLVWGNADLAGWLRSNVGDSCETKRLPVWCLSMQASWRRSLLAGYVDADGSCGVRTEATSVSRALAVGVRLLAVSLGWAVAMYRQDGREGSIEGRKFVGKDSYRVAWREKLEKETVLWDSTHLFTPVREVKPAGRQMVHSLEVAEDESYVADGIVVHNCTHFSRAKGAKPVKKEIRGLAWVIAKVLGLLGKRKPKVLFLENVREFLTWGPLKHNKGAKPDAAKRRELLPRLTTPADRAKFLAGYQYDKNGGRVMVPDKTREGQTFRRFVSQLRALGYHVEWREMNAADYGAPTHRRRLFLVARCDGKPVVWPKPTHGPGRRRKWRSAGECIDWTLPAPSIFLTQEDARLLRAKTGIRCNRPLKRKTMRRVASGIKRYVIQNATPYLIRTGHWSNITGKGSTFRGQPATEPLGAVCSVNDKAVVAPYLIAYYSNGSGKTGHPADRPMPAATAKARFGLAVPYLIRTNHGTTPGTDFMRGQRLDDPLHTLTAAHGTGVAIPFVSQFFGGGHGSPVVGKPATDPLPTVTAVDHNAVAVAHVSQYFGGSPASRGKDPAEPLPTVTAEDHNSLATAHLSQKEECVAAAHLVKLRGSGKSGKRADRPLDTVVAGAPTFGPVAAHLMKFKGNSDGTDAAQPLPTVTGGGACERDAGAAHAMGIGAAALVKFNHGDKQAFGTDEPLRTVLGGANHHGLATAGLVLSSENVEPAVWAAFKHVWAFLKEHLGDDAPAPVVRVDGSVYLIVDIGLRMLTPRELLNAQFTPEIAKDYVLTGTDAEQVRRIGNSVSPPPAVALIRANCADDVLPAVNKKSRRRKAAA